jgi:hypothetical protein
MRFPALTPNCSPNISSMHPLEAINVRREDALLGRTSLMTAKNVQWTMRHESCSSCRSIPPSSARSAVRKRADTLAESIQDVRMQAGDISREQLLIESRKLRETAVDMMEHAALLITKSLEIDKHTAKQSQAEKDQVA